MLKHFFLTHLAPLAAAAQADLVLVYAGILALSGSPIRSSALDGMTLTPGIYKSNSYLTLESVVTIDAQGDSNSVFVIYSASYLAVSPGSTMVLVNGGESREARPVIVDTVMCDIIP